jgi:hypothetical protein
MALMPSIQCLTDFSIREAHKGSYVPLQLLNMSIGQAPKPLR